MEAWGSRARHRDGGTAAAGQEPATRPGTGLEVTVKPTGDSADRRVGSPQAKQLTGRECNPTRQQIIALKLY